jgi:hypothetical protein
MLGFSDLTWLAFIVLICAGVLKLFMLYYEKKALREKAKEEEKVNKPPDLGINVGETIETEEKI